MKTIKRITTILATLFAAMGLYAQSSVQPYRPLSDFEYRPKEYLQHNFVERKEFYVGKPFSELLKDLEVPIIHFWDINRGRVMEDIGIELFFENRDVTSYRIRQQRVVSLSLVIYFEDAVSGAITHRRLQLYGDNWHIINAAFYGERVVRDISVWGENPSDLQPLPDDFFDEGSTLSFREPQRPITKLLMANAPVAEALEATTLA